MPNCCVVTVIFSVMITALWMRELIAFLFFVLGTIYILYVISLSFFTFNFFFVCVCVCVCVFSSIFYFYSLRSKVQDALLGQPIYSILKGIQLEVGHSLIDHSRGILHLCQRK